MVSFFYPGVPALAGGMPALAAAHCWESLIRLKPGLPISDVRINISRAGDQTLIDTSYAVAGWTTKTVKWAKNAKRLYCFRKDCDRK
jgi:hypothetical protein